MLGSRLSEGWWSRLSRYFAQLCSLALLQLCSARQEDDYTLWWSRQHDAALLWWCSMLQAANTVCVFLGMSLLLLLGACGVFDGTSCEGWWHWVYWQAWDGMAVGHCLAATLLLVIGLRAYYLGVLLYGTIRDLDTGLIYRVWLRLTTAPRTVIYDTLYPMNVAS